MIIQEVAYAIPAVVSQLSGIVTQACGAHDTSPGARGTHGSKRPGVSEYRIALV
jgi:hypothetical protein